jgi:protein-S-isoprenylcysteine O-methyltransferase Ste14
MVWVILEIVIYLALFAFFLFVPARTLLWWRAWVLLMVILFVRTISTIIIARVNPGLLLERSKLPLHTGQPPLDKLLIILFMASFAALVGFASFEVFHLRIFPHAPVVVSSAGMILFIFGWWMITLALKANAFAAVVVRLQQERDHTVVETGAYRIVRHPMYAGLMLVIIGMCLWLESYAATLLSVIPISILIIRIRLEENFLKRKLVGYDTYSSKVRWRLIPRIW